MLAVRDLPRHWRPFAAGLVAGAAHSAANALAASGVGLGAPPSGYEPSNIPSFIASGMGAAWELERLRLSLLWHAIAWVVHTLVLNRALFRRGPALLVEIFAFAPMGWLVGGVVPAADPGLWSPDLGSQVWMLVGGGAVVATTLSRLDRATWGLGVPLALVRAAFLFAMSWAATLPFATSVPVWGIPMAGGLAIGQLAALLRLADERR